MRWSDLPLSPSLRTVRQFGGLWLVFFLALATWHGWFQGRTTPGTILAAVGIVGGILGLLQPRLFRPVFVVATILTFPIGYVVSLLLLAILYYGLFTPLALGFRLVGRDQLRLRRPNDVATYWQVKPAAVGVRSYFNQY
jgi:hypothetical protein